MCAIMWLSAALTLQRLGVEPWSVQLGSMVDKVALGQIFLLSTSSSPC